MGDQFGQYSDWIELYNAGNSSVSLKDYGLSDDISKPYQFTFPDISLPANSYLIILASDTNISNINTHWRTAVNANSTWNYRANTGTPPDTNWRNLSFSGNWNSGTGGIGFGDSDDGTTVSTCVSIYMRKTFSVPDTSKLHAAIFNIDFDDGYVAYLNGREFSRVNIGIPGLRPAWNAVAPVGHEAQIYQGKQPDSIYLDKESLSRLLVQGTNVLAVEVHNQSSSNNDITCRPWLSFLTDVSENTFGPTPSFFNAPDKQYLHAAFKLSKDGESVYLSNPSGSVIDQVFYGKPEMDHSAGRSPDGSSSWCLFLNPTPAAANTIANCVTTYASSPVFSLSGGFYSSSQTLTLTTSFPGGVIRYTKDGSDVSQNSTLYNGPIIIDTTQTIRAAVFSSTTLPGPTVTNTYFIAEKTNLPVFSLTTDPDNLWDNETGIFMKGPNAGGNNPYWGANFWQDWEKPVSLEYYDRSKNRAFRFNSGMKITGGWSRSAPQKSLEIMLGDRYGQSDLNYSLMESVKPWLDKWDDFILHTTGNDRNLCKMRDPLMNRLLKDTHNDYLAYEPCLVFINGQNWGVYYIRENDDHHWIESNYGYSKNEVDLLKESYFYPGIEVKKGSNEAFFRMYEYAMNTSPSDPSFYSTMSSMMDLENMADYFIAETYYPNDDWMGGGNNNLKLWRPRKEGGKFRYLIYDLDFGLGYSGTVSNNMLSVARNASPHNHNSDLFKALTNNTQFRRYFINRYADLINTIFKPSNIESMINLYRDTLKNDMHYQWEAWGGDSANWISKIGSMITFANQRPAYARNIVQSEFGLSSQVTLTLQVQPAGAGRIQISTITPESLPWTGVYFNGNPVTITAIPNPGYQFDHWRSNLVINQNNYNSSLTLNFTGNDVITCYFSGSPASTDLVFTEINYHGSDSMDSGDWVEIKNMAAYELDLSGWKFRDGDDHHVYTFPAGIKMAAGAYLVIAGDLQKFNTIHPSVSNVTGGFSFDFSNGGERLRLYDHSDVLVKSVYYQDQLPWPAEADGAGYTLELKSDRLDPDNGINWFSGCLGGSPGGPYTSPSIHVTASGSLNICQGDSIALLASASPLASLQWKRNDIVLNGEINDRLSVMHSGTYHVMVTENGCTANSDTFYVNVMPVDRILSVVEGQVCDSGIVQLQASSTSPVKWYDAAQGGNEMFTGPVFQTPPLSQSTSYYAVASGSCPESRVEVRAFVLSSESSPMVQNAERCGPGDLLLSAVGADSIRWYDNASGGNLLHEGSQFFLTNLGSTGVYYAEAGGVCPSQRIPVSAVVNPVTAEPLVSDTSRCGAGTLTLTAVSSETIRWFDSAMGGLHLGTGNTYTTPVIYDTEVYYVEAGDLCPSGRVAVVAMVSPVTPDPLVSDASRCGPGTLTLHAQGSGQIRWYDQPGGNVLAVSGSYTTPVLQSSGMYFVQAGEECPSSFMPVHADILTLPVPDLGPDTLFISGSSLTLDPGQGFAAYLWSDGSLASTLTLSSPGIYSVTVSNSNACSATDSVMVLLTTGINDNFIERGMQVYPNPVSQYCRVKINDAEAKGLMILRDASGRTAVQVHVSGNSEEIELPVEGLATGIYYLHFISDNAIYVKSIMIK